MRRASLVLLSLQLAASGCSSPTRAPPGEEPKPVEGATISLVAGSIAGPGVQDGPRAQARFQLPTGIARAADGTLFVADAVAAVIRRISPDGQVTTLAGKAGQLGSADGRGSEARFTSPRAVVLGPEGDLFVSDGEAPTIRRVSQQGVVTTWVGSAGKRGTSDGERTSARLRNPEGLAFDAQGNLWIVDSTANTIRRLTPAGQVETWAGTPDEPGATDGPRTEARFNQPTGIAVKADGTVAIADSANHSIRLIETDGTVRTLAGSWEYGQGTEDGTGSEAHFSSPRALAWDGDELVVADSLGNRLRRVTAEGKVTTWTGGDEGSADGTLQEARWSIPWGLVPFTENGTRGWVVCDAANSALRVVAKNAVTTYAGSAMVLGHRDGAPGNARFFRPVGMLPRPDGSVLVADTVNAVVRSIAPNGTVSTVTGGVREDGSTDGTLQEARFSEPTAFVEDGQGGYYLSDLGNRLVRHVSKEGVVSTYAGGPSRGPELTDGPRLDARFGAPAGMARDAAGSLYIADIANHAIRQIGSDGTVATLAGDGLPGGIEGTSARFNEPSDVAVAQDGAIYVADTKNHAIRRLRRTGGTVAVDTFAGAPRDENDFGLAGFADGKGSEARFHEPRALRFDTAGNLYVADMSNHVIRKITPDGTVSTVAGSPGTMGIVLGKLPGALSEPTGLAWRSEGKLLVTFATGVLEIGPK